MIRSAHYILLSAALISGFQSWGQSDTLTEQYYLRRDIALITGYHLQQNHFLEIGIGINRHGRAAGHPTALVYGLSNELKLNEDFIWGVKAGVWLGGGATGMNMGLNLIHYTDFERSSLRLRPEIGLGFGIFRIVYGYNLAIINKEFAGINRHNFGLNILLNLKKIKEERG